MTIFILSKVFAHVRHKSIPCNIVFLFCFAFVFMPATFSAYAQNISSQTPYDPNVAEKIDIEALNRDIASVEGLEDEFTLLMENVYVSVASKMEEEAKKAPSIVTVITAKEIENLGARILKDVLRRVPGFVSGDRTRVTEDARDDSPGYALVDLTLIGKNFFNGLEIKGSIFNLLDKDYSVYYKYLPARYAQARQDVFCRV